MWAAEQRIERLRSAVAFTQEASARGSPSTHALAWLQRQMTRAASELEADDARWEQRRQRQAQKQQMGAAGGCGALVVDGEASLELVFEQQRHRAELAAKDAVVGGLKGQLEALISGVTALQMQRG